MGIGELQSKSGHWSREDFRLLPPISMPTYSKSKKKKKKVNKSPIASDWSVHPSPVLSVAAWPKKVLKAESLLATIKALLKLKLDQWGQMWWMRPHCQTTLSFTVDCNCKRRYKAPPSQLLTRFLYLSCSLYLFSSLSNVKVKLAPNTFWCAGQEQQHLSAGWPAYWGASRENWPYIRFPRLQH
jgi:hypothetical protein